MVTNESSVYAPKNARAAIAKKFEVVPSTISDAVHFNSHSILARDIRAYAVNFLGCALFIDKRVFL